MDGHEELGFFTGITDLFAKLGDTLVEGSGRAEVFYTPDCIQDLVAGEDFSVVAM